MGNKSPTWDYLKAQKAYLYFSDLVVSKVGKADLQAEISFEYSFFKLQLTNTTSQQKYLTIEYSARFNMCTVWCEDKEQENAIEQFTQKSLPKLLKPDAQVGESSWAKFFENMTFQKSLAIADRVGEVGASCGTHLENSFYNEIKLTQEGVFLAQIDLYNAKLLGASSYDMRKLHLFVAWDTLQERHLPSFQNYASHFEVLKFASVLLTFSDYSTNRDCGNRVKTIIKAIGFGSW
jgi:hypothetical protein